MSDMLTYARAKIMCTPN